MKTKYCSAAPSDDARPPGLSLRETTRRRTRNPRTLNHRAPTRSNLSFVPRKTPVAGFRWRHKLLEFEKSRLDALSPADQTILATSLLPELFGGDLFRHRLDYAIPFDVLKLLVPIAYRTIRIEEDLHRPSLRVYSPNARDNAERARWTAFTRLCDIPGLATYNFLLKLAETDGFSIPSHHLRDLARRRALLMRNWRLGNQARHMRSSGTSSTRRPPASNCNSYCCGDWKKSTMN